MAITARMRRLNNDYEQIKKDFKNHKNIEVTPIGMEPYEKYHVTYNVNGIYADDNGQVKVLSQHEVEIVLHSDYPTYKPICKIFTPIWHPNFKDGQICIGDIWGAGESLTDIIINIGDMIQYKSWNSSSPLSADAAKWALENKQIFPIGNANLNIQGDANVNANANADNNTDIEISLEDGNDIDFSAEDFIGVTYTPSAERMQQMSKIIRSGQNASGQINYKVIFEKGIIWGIIGGIVGFILSEFLTRNGGIFSKSFAANILGHPYLAKLYKIDEEFLTTFLYGEVPDSMKELLLDTVKYDFYDSTELFLKGIKQISTISTGFWSAIIASMIGLFMGIGEGMYYGSKDNAKKYALYGFGISIVIGFISGIIAQHMYSSFDKGDGLFLQALVRGMGWSIMGLGIGAASGLIKYEKKRFIYCLLGGGLGAFIGGFLFDYICKIFPSDLFSRFFGILITAVLIGVGVRLLEQLAKVAWLKVTRGEFEGKEFLVFNGLTSVGSTGKNSIVLFKDKLVAEHQFDINLEGNKYVLVDAGSPMGTIVNGKIVDKAILKNGDNISVGNTMLVFNSK